MVEFHVYEIQRDAECLEHWQIWKYDEIPMWNRDRLWKPHLFGDSDGIPMWNRDKCGNAMRIAFTMKFQSGKETNVENVIKSTEAMKFQRERDKYSTSLNIQNPSVGSRFWEEKMIVPNNYLCWQEQIGCNVIIS